MIRSLARYALLFAVTLGICAALLLSVIGLIPQSAIQDSCESALDYFTQNPGFPLLWDSHMGTHLDNYADCALLDVIYNADSSRPFYSAVAAPYYRIEGNPIHLDFAASVRDGLPPNNEYSRYWHGSQVLVRPLLTFTSIEGCRLVLAGVLAALTIVLGVLLIRRRAVRPLVIYLAGMLIVQAWVTAFTLEYIMTFLVMSAACIAAVLCKSERRMTAICLVSGIVTCFLDFLTAETLSFTVPVLLYLMLQKEQGERFRLKTLLPRIIRWGAAWLMGYGLTFAVKWALVYIVLGGDAFRHALISAAYRVERPLEIIGDEAGGTVSTLASLPLVIARNVACLLPAAEGLTVQALGWIILGAAAVFGALFYLFRSERTDGAFVLAVLLIALIPYLRFAVMSSHSADHYFFTFRAQMASIMALIAALAYGLHPSDVLHQGKKKKKVRRA